MRIGIDLERLRNLNSGLGQYCSHLYHNLYELKPENFHFDIYLPKNYNWNLKQQETAHFVSRTDKLLGIRNKSLDIFHATHQDTHLLPITQHSKYLLTIHDLNFLEKHSNAIKIKRKLQALQSKVNKASGITFISEYTKHIAHQYLNISHQLPTKVIYNGNNIVPEAAGVKPEWLHSNRYFFSIGMIQAKKNFHTLLPLAKHFNTPLVIAGSGSTDYTNYIKSMARQMNMEDLLIMPGAISNEEKYWLLQNTTAFLFPSLAEGFGLPVVEAMSAGVPVFLSDLTSLPEIGGAEAYYWSGFEPEHMIKVMEDGLQHFAETPGHSEKLIKRSTMFSWENAAKNYLDFYSTIINA